MFNLRRVLACLILAAVLILGIVIWRHLQQQSPLEVLEALPEQVDLSLQQLHYTQNEDGQRSWTLDAEKAEYQRDSGQASLNKVHLVLYQAGRFGEVTLTADHGALLQELQQVEVWGQVVVTTAEGQRLETERLRYDGNKKQLLNDEPVRAITARMELTGTGLKVDLESGRLLLKRDVRMLLLPEKRKAGKDE